MSQPRHAPGAARYGEGMTIEAIKEEIGHLSDHERRQLFDWLEELEEQAWDREMERDFAPGGRGRQLLDRVDREINEGRLTPLQEGLRQRSEQRERK